MALGVTPGDIGIAHSFLRPSGKIMINNKKIDAITQGEFIEQGTPVMIDRLEQNRVIVKANYNNPNAKALSEEINKKTSGFEFLANINTSEILLWNINNFKSKS